MSEKQVVGRCSECGGPVEQYVSLMIVGPWPPAECRDCGAKGIEGGNLPVIPMRPGPKRQTQDEWTTEVEQIVFGREKGIL